ncbi:MAG: ABC transporter substrate-binding protein [Chloroflexi bacterium]|nr:ABC transporter substrate-binding protein [Chloroflexota bacterium]
MLRLSKSLAAVTGVAVLALAACAPSQAPSGAPAAPASGSSAPAPAATSAPAAPAAAAATATMAPPKGVKLGAAFSQTKAAAVYGVVQKNAVELALAEVNKAGGVKITAVFEDDASDPKQAITVFQKFINQDKVAGILGPTLSNSALSSDPLAQEAKVPVIGVSNTAGGIVEIGNFVFRDSLSEAQVIPNTIKIAKDKLNLKKVALIYGNDDAFTKAGYDVFKAALKANNIDVVAEETFAKGDVDFTPQLTKIKGLNPDAIVASALADEGARILEQKAKLGFADTVRVIGGNGFNSTAIIKNAGKASEGLLVGAAWHILNDDPVNKAFVDAYKAKFNAEPDQFAAQAYTGALIFADAVKRAGPDASGDKIREALTTTKIKSPLGDFSFSADRNANHPPVVQEVKDAKFAVFK